MFQTVFLSIIRSSKLHIERMVFVRVQPIRCNDSQCIYFCKTLYMFQTVIPSIIRSSKLHIQRQVLVFLRPILLPAANLARLAAGSSNGQYRSDKYLTLYVQFWAPDDGRKNFLKHVERLTEINKLWNVASSWLYAANDFNVFNIWELRFTFDMAHVTYNFYYS